MTVASSAWRSGESSRVESIWSLSNKFFYFLTWWWDAFSFNSSHLRSTRTSRSAVKNNFNSACGKTVQYPGHPWQYLSRFPFFVVGQPFLSVQQWVLIPGLPIGLLLVHELQLHFVVEPRDLRVILERQVNWNFLQSIPHILCILQVDLLAHKIA